MFLVFIFCSLEIYKIVYEFFDEIFSVLEIYVVFKYLSNVLYVVFCVYIC